jgi:glutamate receptor ionotropic, NMDA 1
MTGTGHVWIVTEQALNANNTPVGILGLQLNYANSENEHIKVSDTIIFIYFFRYIQF